MGNRIQLNEENLEEVVGGRFTYYEDSEGNYKCKVDNVGTFFAKEGAKRAVTKLIIANDGAGAAEIVNMALATGIFWN